MMTPDVNVCLIDFKNCKGNEFVVPNEDGSYTIVINARLSHDNQLKAYDHAMRHITEEDFCKYDAQVIEAEAHDLTPSQETEKIPANRFEKELRRIHRRRKKMQEEMRKDEERVKFLVENCDMFARAEHYHLYGDDL